MIDIDLAILDSLKNLISPILQDSGFCLIEMKYFFQKKGLVLRLLVDKIHGGITLDQCAMLNDKIGQLIDEAGIIEKRYILEVSSPGISRPLITRQDFLRCINHRVRIFFKQPLDEEFEISGQVSSVTQKGLNLELGGESRFISFNQIKKGKQIKKERK